ncbi:MAG TPA: DUF3574 domain-containing protein [Opitutaceae bacterium]|nr:DUF3574 domain-containing protein [Opitutaceae bacterium]
MKLKSALLFTALVAFSPTSRLAADPAAQATPALKGDAARPEAAHWLRSELYFGAGPADVQDGGIAEIRWRGFLDKEVTPRFPDGLTVFDAYGQWRDRGGATGRLWTKVLVILHEDTPANRAAIDAIRLAWKASTHDQSVLLVTEPVDVSF